MSHFYEWDVIQTWTLNFRKIPKKLWKLERFLKIIKHAKKNACQIFSIIDLIIQWIFQRITQCGERVQKRLRLIFLWWTTFACLKAVGRGTCAFVRTAIATGPLGCGIQSKQHWQSLLACKCIHFCFSFLYIIWIHVAGTLTASFTLLQCFPLADRIFSQLFSIISIRILNRKNQPQGKLHILPYMTCFLIGRSIYCQICSQLVFKLLTRVLSVFNEMRLWILSLKFSVHCIYLNDAKKCSKKFCDQ